MSRLARVALWASSAGGVFLAFAWPFVVSADPGSAAFHAAAVATVIVFFASLGATLAARR